MPATLIVRLPLSRSFKSTVKPSVTYATKRTLLTRVHFDRSLETTLEVDVATELPNHILLSELLLSCSNPSCGE